jgi:hypothetical protein
MNIEHRMTIATLLGAPVASPAAAWGVPGAVCLGQAFKTATEFSDFGRGARPHSRLLKSSGKAG